MARDPAFLFYPGDWQGGTATFSRFLKGCYMDVLIAQFNNGHLSLEEIKTVLGSDFGQAWPTLQKKFVADKDGLFFNVKLESEVTKRKQYCASRSKNRLGSNHMNNISDSYDSSYVEHMENENGNVIKNKKGVTSLGSGKNFILIQPRAPDSIKFRIHGEGGLREFFEMNGSIMREPDQARKFMFSNTGKPYNDFRHLFNDYKQFCNKQFG